MMLELTEENFVETVTQNDTVFVDFWAAWCGPCRMFGPIFEKVAEQHPDALFAKVDTDAQQALAGGLGISSIPTLMAFRGGAQVFAQPGAMNESQFTQLVEAVKEIDLEDIKRQIAEAQAQAEGGEQPQGDSEQ